MKISLLILFLIISLSLKAQYKSAIDVIIGTDYSSQYVRNTNQDSFYIRIFDKEKRWNAGKIGYRFGINYNRQVTPHFYIKTGLRFVNMGYESRVNITDLRWISELNPVMGVFEPDPTLPHRIDKYIYNYFFLEIPINGRCEFTSTKWRPSLEAGIAPHIYLTTSSTTVLDIEQQTGWQRSKSNRTLSWVANAAFGINYSLHNRHQGFLQSNASYHLNPIGKKATEEPIKGNFYSFGLETGFRFQL